MINERPTEKYNVFPSKLIEASFSGAYDSNNSAPVIYKPDTVVTISSCVSMLMICGMCVLTWTQTNSVIWLVVGAVFLMILALIVRKHFKKLKEYKNANSQGAEKFDFKAEYISLFPEDLPEQMSASEFAVKIAQMQGKQKKDVYNNAVRNLITKLNKVNNPDEIICKNLSLYGNLMTQYKHRYFITQEEGKIVVFDSDFQNPKGELVIDHEDVLAFGDPGSFDLGKITKNGVKLSQDVVVVEIKTGDSDTDRLYLEVHSREFDKLKKMLGGRKHL